MSPDWAANAVSVPFASFGKPQSLNLYAYVGNDPVDGEDADGHGGEDPGLGFMPSPEQDQSSLLLLVRDPLPMALDQQNANAPLPLSDQDGAAQNTSQTQTQQKPGEQHKGEPYSLKPEGSTPVGNNGAKIFKYQVVDPSGRPVRDVSIQEHVKTVAADNAEAVPNPNPVRYPTGQVRDQIGPLSPPGNEHAFLKTEQTFTATKGGHSYEMSTKTNQYVDVTNRRVTVQVVILVP